MKNTVNQNQRRGSALAEAMRGFERPASPEIVPQVIPVAETQEGTLGEGVSLLRGNPFRQLPPEPVLRYPGVAPELLQAILLMQIQHPGVLADIVNSPLITEAQASQAQVGILQTQVNELQAQVRMLQVQNQKLVAENTNQAGMFAGMLSSLQQMHQSKLDAEKLNAEVLALNQELLANEGGRAAKRAKREELQPLYQKSLAPSSSGAPSSVNSVDATHETAAQTERSRARAGSDIAQGVGTSSETAAGVQNLSPAASQQQRSTNVRERSKFK